MFESCGLERLSEGSLGGTHAKLDVASVDPTAHTRACRKSKKEMKGIVIVIIVACKGRDIQWVS